MAIRIAGMRIPIAKNAMLIIKFELEEIRTPKYAKEQGLIALISAMMIPKSHVFLNKGKLSGLNRFARANTPKTIKVNPSPTWMAFRIDELNNSCKNTALSRKVIKNAIIKLASG